MTYAEKIIFALGGTKNTAQHFGITQSAVSQWYKNGVPAKRELEFMRDFPVLYATIITSKK